MVAGINGLAATANHTEFCFIRQSTRLGGEGRLMMSVLTRRKMILKAAAVPVAVTGMAACTKRELRDYYMRYYYLKDLQGSILGMLSSGDGAISLAQSFPLIAAAQIIEQSLEFIDFIFLVNTGDTVRYAPLTSITPDGFPSFGPSQPVAALTGTQVSYMQIVGTQLLVAAAGDSTAASPYSFTGRNLHILDIDGGPPRLVRSIPLGTRNPTRFYWSETGTDIYGIDSQNLFRWDETGERRAQLIEPGLTDVVSTGKYVMVTNPVTNKVHFYDRELYYAGAVNVVGPGRLAGCYDGAWVISKPASGASSIYELNLDTISVGRSVVSGQGSYSLRYNEYFRRLYVTNTNENTVSVIDPMTMAVIQRQAVGTQPRDLF